MVKNSICLFVIGLFFAFFISLPGVYAKFSDDPNETIWLSDEERRQRELDNFTKDAPSQEELLKNLQDDKKADAGAADQQQDPKPGQPPEAKKANKPPKAKEANKPSECGSQMINVNGVDKPLVPENCLFLEEPIGGRPGYDLYTVGCIEKDCDYKLWSGEAVTGGRRGPLQAILTYIPEKLEEQGVTLLYGYLGLIYRYMSGIIAGVVILFIIIGGIQMTTSSGDPNKFDEGKKRIIHAITGMILWFLASLILYTINPTFFVF